MALQPSDVLIITPDQIIAYYHRSGYAPQSLQMYRRMLREQLLQMKEMHAFALDMQRRGYTNMESLITAWENSIKPIEEELRKVEIAGNH